MGNLPSKFLILSQNIRIRVVWPYWGWKSSRQWAIACKLCIATFCFFFSDHLTILPIPLCSYSCCLSTTTTCFSSSSYFSSPSSSFSSSSFISFLSFLFSLSSWGGRGFRFTTSTSTLFLWSKWQWSASR